MKENKRIKESISLNKDQQLIRMMKIMSQSPEYINK